MEEETQFDKSKSGDQKGATESSEAIWPYGPEWFVLALGLACSIGYLGSSAFLRNCGFTNGELRLILMLLSFPVEWGGALLVLALLGDFRRAVDERRSRVPADQGTGRR